MYVCRCSKRKHDGWNSMNSLLLVASSSRQEHVSLVLPFESSSGESATTTQKVHFARGAIQRCVQDNASTRNQNTVAYISMQKDSLLHQFLHTKSVTLARERNVSPVDAMCDRHSHCLLETSCRSVVFSTTVFLLGISLNPWLAFTVQKHKLETFFFLHSCLSPRVDVLK